MRVRVAVWNAMRLGSARNSGGWMASIWVSGLIMIVFVTKLWAMRMRGIHSISIHRSVLHKATEVTIGVAVVDWTSVALQTRI